jgi:hypothetical protein
MDGSLVSLCWCSLFFALTPAMRVFRFNLTDALKERGRLGGGVGHGRLRGALVIAEVALALVLLIGGTLMAASFTRLQKVNAGFDPPNLLTAEISMPDFRYSDPEHVSNFYHQLLDRVEALPDVQSAAVTSGLPPDEMRLQDTFTLEGRPTPPGRIRWRTFCSSAKTISVPLAYPCSRAGLFRIMTSKALRWWSSSTRPWRDSSFPRKIHLESVCGKTAKTHGWRSWAWSAM